VTRLRHLCRVHRRFAMLAILAVLALRLMMPAGFMPTIADGHITVGVCSGTGSTMVTIAIPGLKPDRPDGTQHNAEAPCAFAGLAMPALPAADPILLAIAIAFVFAIGRLAVDRVRVAAPARLRPPLRAPPATA
jgi:hypothetical protein